MQNRKHAAHQYEVGGVERNKLGTFAWDAIKDSIDEVGKDLALTLRFAYGEVWRYNAIINFIDSLPKLSILKRLMIGKAESSMSNTAIRAIVAIARAEKELVAYLEK